MKLIRVWIGIVCLCFLGATSHAQNITISCLFSATTGNSFGASTQVAGQAPMLNQVSCPAGSAFICDGICSSQVSASLPGLNLSGYQSAACGSLNLPHNTTVKAYSRTSGFGLNGLPVSGASTFSGIIGRVVRTNAVYSCPSGSTLSGTICTAPLILSAPTSNLDGSLNASKPRCPPGFSLNSNPSACVAPATLVSPPSCTLVRN